MWSEQWSQWSWMWTWVQLGSLIVDPVYEAGGICANNPLYNSVLAVDEDEAKEICCELSPNCASYYRARPIKTCIGYIPPVIRKSVHCLISLILENCYMLPTSAFKHFMICHHKHI